MSFTAIITANIQQFQRNLDTAQGRMGRFERSVEGNINNMDDGFMKFSRRVGGLLASAFAVERVVNFGVELGKLGMQAEGISEAFYRFSDDTQMRRLQDATAGTVNKLELMRRVVMAKNFGIPIENLANLFAFATRRAQETGESVDYLVDSIVMGIGRKSPLILDNLGISAVQLREKLKGVGTETASVADIAAAVGEIAAESLTQSGIIIENNGIKVQQAAAEWQNLKLIWGELIADSEGLSSFLQGITRQIKLLGDDTGRWARILEFLFGNSVNQRYADALNDINDQLSKNVNNSKQAAEQTVDLNENVGEQTQTINDLKEKLKELNTQLGGYAINQQDKIQATLREIDTTEKLIKSLTTLQVVRDSVVAGNQISTLSETPTIASPFIPQDIEVERLEAWKQRQLEKYQEMLNSAKEEIDYLNNQINLSIADGFANSLEAAFSGQNITGVLGAFLEPIANFLQQEGAMLVAHGLAIEVFKKSLQSLNGIAAIAAGTAMIATAAAFKGVVSAGSRQFSGGSSMYSGGGGASYREVQPEYPTGPYGGEVQFKIKGDDLVGVLNVYNSKKSRL